MVKKKKKKKRKEKTCMFFSVHWRDHEPKNINQRMHCGMQGTSVLPSYHVLSFSTGIGTWVSQRQFLLETETPLPLHTTI